MDIAAFCRCIVSLFSLYEHAYGRSLAPRSSEKGFLFERHQKAVVSFSRKRYFLVVESSLVDFSFSLRSFVRSFVRSASFPLLSTSSPSSSRDDIFVIFLHITPLHTRRRDTTRTRHINFFARAFQWASSNINHAAKIHSQDAFIFAF
jgi:hypothetical protein